MKQTELANQLGISKSYLSMILNGQRKANPALARKLERYSGELVHKKTVNFEAKPCLGSKHSTAELHPQVAAHLSV